MPPKKGEKRKRTKDPDRPKRPLSAYFAYAKCCREELAAQGKSITRVGDFTKEVSARWRALTDKEKKPFEEEAAKDKKRFQAELAVYKGKQPVKKKRAATPYFHFLADFRKRPECGTMHIKDISKQAGALWREMNEADKKPYLIKYENQKKELAEAASDDAKRPRVDHAAAEEEEEEDEDDYEDDEEEDDED